LICNSKATASDEVHIAHCNQEAGNKAGLDFRSVKTLGAFVVTHCVITQKNVFQVADCSLAGFEVLLQPER